jgi:hypothetical protein
MDSPLLEEQVNQAIKEFLEVWKLYLIETRCSSCYCPKYENYGFCRTHMPRLVKQTEQVNSLCTPTAL